MQIDTHFSTEYVYQTQWDLFVRRITKLGNFHVALYVKRIKDYATHMTDFVPPSSLFLVLKMEIKDTPCTSLIITSK